MSQRGEIDSDPEMGVLITGRYTNVLRYWSIDSPQYGGINSAG